MESVRITMLSCFVAAILVVGTRAVCDADAASTCIADFGAGFETLSSDPAGFCTSFEDTMANLEVCVNDAVADCEDSIKSVFELQLPTFRQQGELACGGGGGGGGGGNGGIDPCLMAMGACFGPIQNIDQIMPLMNPGEDGNTEELNQQQEELCRTLEDVDFGAIRGCLEEADCADFNILAAGGDPEPGTPAITTSTMVNLVEGLCKPECENYPTKWESIQQCESTINPEEEDIDTADCGDIDTYFTCVRGGIDGCEALSNTLMTTLNSVMVLDDVKERCPNANLALTDDGDSDSATSTKGLLFLIATALFFSLFI